MDKMETNSTLVTAMTVPYAVVGELISVTMGLP